MSDTPPAPAPSRARTRTVECPSCGGTVIIRANGISITAICAACGSPLDVVNPDVRLIAEARARTRDLLIPLGTRGVLAGTTWEAVGFQSRTEIVGGRSWDEYLLFNPWRGFRFLVHDDAVWSLFCMVRQDVPDPEAGFEGQRYRHTGMIIARTNYVMGEFYWRAQAGDRVTITEYEGGAGFLVREQTDQEVIWSRGVRLPASAVRTAFGLKGELDPASDAFGPTRASAEQRSVGLIIMAQVAVVALLFAQAIPFGTSRSAVVFSQSFHTAAAEAGSPIVAGPFTIPDKGGNLRISTQSEVSNNWVELGLTLVGPQDETYSATASIEYYYGQDSDGYWSEGGKTTNLTFRSVPGGDYRLVIEPYAGVFEATGGYQWNRPAGNAIDYTVTVTRHVPAWGNFWLALVLLLAWPIASWIYRRYAKD